MRRDSRYMAILRTLAYRRTLYLLCALVFGCLIMLRLLMRNEIPQHLQGRWGSLVILPLALAAMTSFFLCLHFRELLSPGRLATVPGVRWPHFCLACWVCPLPVLAGCLLVLRPYVYSPNVFAVGVAFFAIAALWSRLPIAIGMLFPMAIAASNFLGHQYFAALFSGPNEDAAMWCAWGLIGIGIWMWRLVSRAESMAETTSGTLESFDRPGRDNPALAAMAAPCGRGNRLDRVAGFVGYGFNQRVELRRLGNGASAPWVEAITPCVLLVGLAIGVRSTMEIPAEFDTGVAALLTSVVPVCVFVLILRRLENRLALDLEMLGPVSRSDYVLEIGLGFVRDLFEMWAVISVGALAAGFLAVGPAVLSIDVLIGLLPSPSVTLISFLAGLAFGARTLVLGVFVGFSISWGVSAGWVMLRLSEIGSSSALSLLLSGLVSVLLLLASFPMARWAHRRWCEAELGARRALG